jgi:hypothetical protein
LFTKGQDAIRLTLELPEMLTPTVQSSLAFDAIHRVRECFRALLRDLEGRPLGP